MSAARWGVMAAALGLFLVLGMLLSREHYVPERQQFAGFPHELAGYASQFVPVSNAALRMLDLTDYVSRNYVRESDGHHINLYIGYHGKQVQGSVIHSPTHCLPANGWVVVDRQRIPMPGQPDGPLINRIVVGHGAERQLVYYWYQGRGRIVTDEFVAVLLRARDVALRNRSDEALVRFAIGTTDPDSERALREFIAVVAPMIEPYVPA